MMDKSDKEGSEIKEYRTTWKETWRAEQNLEKTQGNRKGEQKIVLKTKRMSEKANSYAQRTFEAVGSDIAVVRCFNQLRLSH